MTHIYRNQDCSLNRRVTVIDGELDSKAFIKKIARKAVEIRDEITLATQKSDSSAHSTCSYANFAWRFDVKFSTQPHFQSALLQFPTGVAGNPLVGLIRLARSGKCALRMGAMHRTVKKLTKTVESALRKQTESKRKRDVNSTKIRKRGNSDSHKSFDSVDCCVYVFSQTTENKLLYIMDITPVPFADDDDYQEALEVYKGGMMSVRIVHITDTSHREPK